MFAHPRPLTMALAAVLLVTACQKPTPELPTFSLKGSEGGIAPSFGHSGDKISLIYLQPKDSGHVLMRAELSAGSNEWSTPQVMLEQPGIMANAYDIPHLIGGEPGTPQLVWHQDSPAGPYKYNLRLLMPGGSIAALHPDQPAGEHSFVSAMPTGSGSVAFAWLQNTPPPGTPDSIHLPTQLHFRNYPTDSASTVLDSMVCDCCPTALAQTDNGLILAFRGRLRGGKSGRPILVKDFHNGEWSPSYMIDDGVWQLDGCPVNGPSLAAKGMSVDLAWFTAEGNRPRILTCHSQDGGASWQPRRELPCKNPLGQVALATDGANAWATWLELDTTTHATRIMAQAISKKDEPLLVSTVQAGRPAFRPQIALQGDRALVVWSDSCIRWASLPNKE